MSCDGKHADPKCWTKETDHCSLFGCKMASGETAYIHREMLRRHGRAPVRCSRCFNPALNDEWESFIVVGRHEGAA